MEGQSVPSGLSASHPMGFELERGQAGPVRNYHRAQHLEPTVPKAEGPPRKLSLHRLRTPDP